MNIQDVLDGGIKFPLLGERLVDLHAGVTRAQYELLARLQRRTGRSRGALIRAAIDSTFVRPTSNRTRGKIDE